MQYGAARPCVLLSTLLCMAEHAGQLWQEWSQHNHRRSLCLGAERRSCSLQEVQGVCRQHTVELGIECHGVAHVRELEARKAAVLQEQDVVLTAERACRQERAHTQHPHVWNLAGALSQPGQCTAALVAWLCAWRSLGGRVQEAGNNAAQRAPSIFCTMYSWSMSLSPGNRGWPVLSSAIMHLQARDSPTHSMR